MDALDEVWLNGERYNVLYLLQPSTGRVLDRFTGSEPGAVTGGIGQRCGRRFVAVYVDPASNDLMVVVDGVTVPITSATRATVRRSRSGLRIGLSIAHPDGPPLEAIRWMSPGSGLARLLDPARDSIEDDLDDFLPVVADLVNDPAAQAHFRRHRDPLAGPWNRE